MTNGSTIFWTSFHPKSCRDAIINAKDYASLRSTPTDGIERFTLFLVFVPFSAGPNRANSVKFAKLKKIFKPYLD